MNPTDYLESVRNFLLTDSCINRHQIMREYGDVEKSYIRARLTLTDESFLEFSEYIEQGSGAEIVITKYSYHWIDKDGKILRRWEYKTFPQTQKRPTTYSHSNWRSGGINHTWRADQHLHGSR